MRLHICYTSRKTSHLSSITLFSQDTDWRIAQNRSFAISCNKSLSLLASLSRFLALLSLSGSLLPPRYFVSLFVTSRSLCRTHFMFPPSLSVCFFSVSLPIPVLFLSHSPSRSSTDVVREFCCARVVLVKVDRQGQENSVATGWQHQGKAADAFGANYLRETLARMADICLGRGRGSNRRLVGRGGGEGQRQGRGARTDTAARGTVTTWTAPTGMAMAAIGIITAAIGTVIAAIRKTKTALRGLPTGTIATVITADLVSSKGSRYILSNDI